jgi:hypothetical protein
MSARLVRYDGPTGWPWSLECSGDNGVWLFRHRHLAVQFAARRGIRLEET